MIQRGASCIVDHDSLHHCPVSKAPELSYNTFTPLFCEYQNYNYTHTHPRMVLATSGLSSLEHSPGGEVGVLVYPQSGVIFSLGLNDQRL